MSIDLSQLDRVWGGDDGTGGDTAAAQPDPNAGSGATAGAAKSAAGGMGGMGGMNPMSMISGFANIAQMFMKNKSGEKQGAPSAAPRQGPAPTQLASADPGSAGSVSGGNGNGDGGGGGGGRRGVSISIQIG